MFRAALGAAIGILALTVAFVTLRTDDPPPVAYHSLERDIARVTLQGEVLAARGDECLNASREGDPAAVTQCRNFLMDAEQWSRPLDEVGQRLSELDMHLEDDALIAVGATNGPAVDSLAALAAVTARLGSQVEQIDAWMVGTAQAAERGRRGGRLIPVPD